MPDFQKCFIMLCTNTTEAECLGRNLFGDRQNRLEYLAEIRPGDIGFLLNTTKNELIGPFKAKSEAELDIEPDAWSGKFRAQVRVEPIRELKRLTEAATILANAGIDLVGLRFGALVPLLPVHSQAIANKILVSFNQLHTPI